MERLLVQMFNVQKLISFILLFFNLALAYIILVSILPQFAFYLLCFALLNFYFAFYFQFALLLQISYLIVSSKQGCNLLKSLTSFLDLFNLSQIIKDSTRVSAKSSSTIDLILVSDWAAVCSKAVVLSLLTFCLLLL